MDLKGCIFLCLDNNFRGKRFGRKGCEGVSFLILLMAKWFPLPLLCLAKKLSLLFSLPPFPSFPPFPFYSFPLPPKLSSKQSLCLFFWIRCLPRLHHHDHHLNTSISHPFVLSAPSSPFCLCSC